MPAETWWRMSEGEEIWGRNEKFSRERFRRGVNALVRALVRVYVHVRVHDTWTESKGRQDERRMRGVLDKRCIFLGIMCVCAWLCVVRLDMCVGQ